MPVDEEFELDEDAELSLLETLDHVLDRGLVIAGEVRIAVADVDLVFLGLNVLLVGGLISSFLGLYLGIGRMRRGTTRALTGLTGGERQPEPAE